MKNAVFILFLIFSGTYQAHAQRRIVPVIDNLPGHLNRTQKQRDSIAINGTMITLKKMGVKLTMPKGFSVFPGGVGSFEYNPAKLPLNFNYAISNKDSTAIISFMASAADKERAKKSTKLMRMFNPGFKDYDPDKTWLYATKAKADTTLAPINYYSPAQLKKSNADHVTEFLMKCLTPFKQQYVFYKSINVYKKDRGLIRITYFHRNKPPKEMAKLVKQTAGMFYFLEQ